ncbi:annexin A13-like [Saccoglossus kowalevskii]|uniref:Annexin n=1 Tax=Saccoglossus kowalevskii TaxID=10224 RepID=A0ABM0GPY3_SACKO|nr:PREDICTED: annexin A7-like [Saccoglossus kowalevskii]
MGCGSSSSAGKTVFEQKQEGKTRLKDADVRIGLNGPVQVAKQPFAPAGSPAIYHGTILPMTDFNPDVSADKLRESMKGVGTKDDELIQAITALTNEQRQVVRKTYHSKFGRDLIQDVKSETSGDFEDVLVHLLEPAAEYDAWLLHETMDGPGTEEDILLEILCFRTKEELTAIRQAYHQKYGKTLDDDIKGDTSGNFEKMLLILLEGVRDRPHVVVEAFARADAKLMYDSGEGRLGTDDDRFIDIFTTRSWDQLAASTFMYEKMYGKPIEQVLESEFSFDMLFALKKMVVFARDRATYFATMLYDSMKGLGTDDEYLQRLVITRCEVDMLEIKEAFKQKYGLTLSKMIRDDTSHKYKDVLLALIN